MNAIQILVEEHDQILTMIEVSQALLEKHNADNLPIEDVKFLVDFIQNFADKYHHLKEEDVLFVEMGNYGMPPFSGPVAVMLSEHNQGRAYIKEVIEGISAYRSGNTAAYNQIKENLLGYGTLLTNHIAKENNILYPMAEEIIPENVIEDMTRNFEVTNTSTVNNEYYEVYLKSVSEYSEKYL